MTAIEYRTDSGGGEMDQAHNGEVGPQCDPKVAAMEEDVAKSEATFRFSVPNFSKFKVVAHFNNLTCTRIKVQFDLFIIFFPLFNEQK